MSAPLDIFRVVRIISWALSDMRCIRCRRMTFGRWVTDVRATESAPGDDGMVRLFYSCRSCCPKCGMPQLHGWAEASMLEMDAELDAPKP